MRILVIGGGGREHAIAWKISNNSSVEEIFAIPGNGGLQKLAKCFSQPSDISGLADFALEHKIDLTFVGPEALLVAGIVDEFEKRGLKIFGPTKKAAQIEGSKSFAKNIMQKYQIPAAVASTFTNYGEACRFIEYQSPPFVIKADGLAGGKGVTIAESLAEAKQALHECLVSKKFGTSGEKVLIEEYLEGQEVSVLSFSDGTTILPMAPAQDYKRVYDNDQGPNTGGMGCYSPVPVVDKQTYQEIVEKIIEPTITALSQEGIKYKGVLYAGIILTKEGPKVLEYNCRFGDPETQVIIPRYQGDLLEAMLAVVEENLSNYLLEWTNEKCITVVLASEGYPRSPLTGREISGLEKASQIEGVTIFQAGTRSENGKVYTSGGRVLNVTALGKSFSQARERAYSAARLIKFEGCHYRCDIASRAVEASKEAQLPSNV
jgi:phosphoribosylamine--glycine ligase